MKISELKPNTLYATCDGRMIETGDVVEGGYWHYEHSTPADGENPSSGMKQVRTIAKGDPRKTNGTDLKADPWADCQVGRGRQMYGLRIIAGPGIKVTEFDYDGDGNKIAKTRVERVLKAQDLPGTWDDYRLLHMDKIAGRWAKRLAAEERTRMSADILSRMKAAGIKGGPHMLPDHHGGRGSMENGVGVHVSTLYEDKNGKLSAWERDGDGTVKVHNVPVLSLTGPALDQLLNILDGRTPSGRKRKASK